MVDSPRDVVQWNRLLNDMNGRFSRVRSLFFELPGCGFPFIDDTAWVYVKHPDAVTSLIVLNPVAIHRGVVFEFIDQNFALVSVVFDPDRITPGGDEVGFGFAEPGVHDEFFGLLEGVGGGAGRKDGCHEEYGRQDG